MNQKRDPEKKNGLFIPTRQVTAYTSFALSLLGAVFMSGYFFGKTHMVDQFVAKVEQDSFADQISASLCSLYDQGIETFVLAQNDQDELGNDTVEKQTIASSIKEELVVECDVLVASVEPVQELASPSENSITNADYYAQLIGYGTQKAADQFAQKLQKKGIPAVVKARKSQTAQGKQSTWYQVVTEPFSDKNALEQLVQRIAKDEKIQGIQLVSC